jgi:hypothetical protein
MGPVILPSKYAILPFGPMKVASLIGGSALMELMDLANGRFHQFGGQNAVSIIINYVRYLQKEGVLVFCFVSFEVL